MDYQSHANRRLGFTLIELLVTVSIIAIMATLVMFAMFSATETAREHKTKATIAKLHAVIAERYEGYRTRRASMRDEPYTDSNSNGNWNPGEPYTDVNGNGTWDYKASERPVARLNAIRETMRMELPDRWSDVVDNPVFIDSRPAVNRRYKRQYDANASHPEIGRYESAECLYLIVSADTEDMENFGTSEISDFDQDGMREFKDAWDRPISFLRWAPGFKSELQPTNDPKSNHDPFDTRNLDPAAFALFPLIFSQGQDAALEVSDGGNSFQYSTRSRPVTIAGVGMKLLNYPYFPSDPSQPASPANKMVGEWNDTDGDGANGSIDNIHNHLIGTR